MAAHSADRTCPAAHKNYTRRVRAQLSLLRPTGPHTRLGAVKCLHMHGQSTTRVGRAPRRRVWSTTARAPCPVGQSGMRSRFFPRPKTLSGRACAHRHSHGPIASANSATDRARVYEQSAATGQPLKRGISRRGLTRSQTQPTPPHEQGPSALARGKEGYLWPGRLDARPLR